MSAWRRRAAVCAAALLVGATAAVAGQAPAARAAACSGTSGVTVVVDFRSLGGGAQVRCAPGDPASSLAALTGAGFGYGFVPRQPGLVCQINGLPEPCNGAPTNAYWSFWHAQPGGSWTYSSVGAGSYNPAPGSVDGWSFGAGQPPGIAPPVAAAPAPPPPPPPAPQPQPTQPATAKPAPPPASPSRPAGQPAPPATSQPATTAATTAATGASTGAGAAASSRSGRSTAAQPDAQPVAQVDSGGSAGTAGLLVAVALITAIAAMGVWKSRTRRSPDP